MHHGIPFLLEENSILQIPISSNNPSTSRGTLLVSTTVHGVLRELS